MDRPHLERSREEDVTLGRALALVRHLRRHCDWDARQTPDSLLPYLLEEAHEVADAVRRRDPDLAAELGDLLLNIAFQIVLAEEAGSFGAEEVVSALERKMITRHPHVYGEADEAPDWESLKASERATAPGRPDDEGPGDESPDERDGPATEVPRGLDALSRSLRVQERASAVGFDWPDASGAIEKLREEVHELEGLLGAPVASPSAAGPPPAPEVVDEAGDVLFAAVNVCRLAGVHPLAALRGATDKFSRRFRAVRRRAASMDVEPSDLEGLNRLWNEVKARERHPETEDGPPDEGETDPGETARDGTGAEGGAVSG